MKKDGTLVVMAREGDGCRRLAFRCLQDLEGFWSGKFGAKNRLKERPHDAAEVLIPCRYVTKQWHGLVGLSPQVRRIVSVAASDMKACTTRNDNDLHYSVKDAVLVPVHPVHKQRHIALRPEEVRD